MLTYVFPGQGSQQKGMGKDLFDLYPELVSQADAILGYSIKNLCLEDPDLKLSLTQYTQVALFVVNVLSYLHKVQANGVKPDFVAGHSLGEYNALFAAGAFDFANGVKLVKKRGELMSLATGGGMAAVIGPSEAEIKAILSHNQLSGIDIANYNSPSQIVISGPVEEITRAKAVFEAAKAVKSYIPLKVSGAFHSRYMENSRRQFEECINQVEFAPLAIPVISNVTARPYRQASIKQSLLEQLTSSVQWSESIRYLMGKGVTEFEEVGVGKILTGMIKRIRTEAEPLVVADEVEALVAVAEEPQTTPVAAATLPEAIPEKEPPEIPPTDCTSEKGKSAKKTKDKISPVPEAEPQPQIPPQAAQSQRVTASSLGDADFKKDYNLKYAYLTGAMFRGIASPELVVKVGKAGMLGFLGTGGMDLRDVEAGIQSIQRELNQGEAYGMNLLYNPNNPEKEEQTVDLFLQYGIRNVEAAAYITVTPALVRFRLTGLKRDSQGTIVAPHRIIGKLSRPEIAELFLSPPPERIVAKLLQEQKITAVEAGLAKEIPLACDISVEADSAGHTDQGVAYVLMPAMLKLRDEMMAKYQYARKIRVGAAGGIGTPHAALAAFMMGADFIVTGSINQCTVEARTSDRVKDLLQQINVQDTDYAPAGDMFELGARVQVLKRGVFFPARANKLFELYRQYQSIEELDAKTQSQLQERFFHKSFSEVFQAAKAFYSAAEIAKAEQNPKQKMALIFRWYFGNSTQLALNGDEAGVIDYQIHCGPALGAFNQWVKGTELENWANRHVDGIGIKLMEETAQMLNRRIREISA